MKSSPTLADGLIREWQRPLYRKIDPNNWLVSHIAQARKFVLDESMSAFMGDLAYASLLTCETNHKAHLLLDSMRSLARLPHALTWIEYDMKAKRQRVHDEYNSDAIVSPDATPDRSGWLLLQHPTLETAFMAIQCTSHSWEDGVRVAQPQSCFFGYAWRSDNGPPPWPTDPVYNREYPVDVRGRGVVMARPEGLLSGITNYVSESVAVVQAPHIPRSLVEHHNKVVSREFNILGELASDLRYLWSLLATINDLPTSMREVKSDRGYVSRGSYKKFVSHTVISLTIPAKRYRQVANRAIAIARRRAHQVRGHWRRDRFHPGERIWIREHQRGDASLGFVLHDYSVHHDTTP